MCYLLFDIFDTMVCIFSSFAALINSSLQFSFYQQYILDRVLGSNNFVKLFFVRENLNGFV